MAEGIAMRECRRRISPEAGRALEILGHAIDYLADDHFQQEGAASAGDPVVEAMRILMERNREIYLACPEAVSWSERLERWLPRLRSDGKR